MARKRKAQNATTVRDWKSSFVFYGPSIEDEREIQEYVNAGKILEWSDFLDELLGNGGSIKLSHSNTDGGVFVTLATDKQDTDYGGFNFGMSYPTLSGALVLADWFYHTRLLTDVGLKHLPIKVEDWLVLP